MRIAVSTRRVADPVHGEARDALSRDWVRYLNETWPDMFVFPAVNLPERTELWADNLDPDALILSNGNDWNSCPERDETERQLVQWFRKRGRPILGVCRGLQVLNAMFGGRVETDLVQSAGMRHGGVTHEIDVEGKAFTGLAGGARLRVNSYHDQGVLADGLASGLVTFARASGGVVEGFHHESEPILAIQWHPERPGGDPGFDKALIAGLLKHGAFWC